MKNQIKNILLLITISVFAISCDDDPVLYESGDYVVFESASSGVSENNTAAAVRVYRSSVDLSQALTINFTFSAVYASTTDFFDEGADASDTFSTFGDVASLTIPAGEAYGSITFYGVDDVLSSGDKTVTITIASVSLSSYNIGFPGPDSNQAVHSLTIIDDDCPIDLASFEGGYTMTVLGTEDSCCPDFDLCADPGRDCSGAVTLTADASDPSGTSAILTHPSFGSPYGIKFVTCPLQTEVITPMSSWFGFAWNMQQGGSPGSYDEVSKTIKIVGVLGGNGDFEITLTKN